jgi:hypothetical protein
MSPRTWARYAWAVHLCGLVFLAGVAWAGVTAQTVRIDKLELETKDIPSTLSRIEQKVDDLHDTIFKGPR